MYMCVFVSVRSCACDYACTVCDNITLTFRLYRTLEVRSVHFRYTENERLYCANSLENDSRIIRTKDDWYVSAGE